jgi:hypothetical protein
MTIGLLPLAWGLVYLVTVLVLTRRRPAAPPADAVREAPRRAA